MSRPTVTRSGSSGPVARLIAALPVGVGVVISVVLSVCRAARAGMLGTPALPVKVVGWGGASAPATEIGGAAYRGRAGSRGDRRRTHPLRRGVDSRVPPRRGGDEPARARGGAGCPARCGAGGLAGVGSVVLVSGEAGIGKSSLAASCLGSFPVAGASSSGGATTWRPRVLGPLRDLVGRVGPALADAVRSTDRSAVLDAIRDELDAAPGPTILVVPRMSTGPTEATLDVLRSSCAGWPLPCTRCSSSPTGTTEVPSERPAPPGPRPGLQWSSRCAGSGWPGSVPLRSAGSARPAMSTLTDFSGVTSGSPYFVTESSRRRGLRRRCRSPSPTRSGARLAHLDPGAPCGGRAARRHPVGGRAVAGRGRCCRASGVGGGALVVAEERGLLRSPRDGVAFRHELTRRAVVDTMPAARTGRQRTAGSSRRSWTGPMPSSPGWSTTPTRPGTGTRSSPTGPEPAAEAIAAGAHRQAGGPPSVSSSTTIRTSEPGRRGRPVESCAVESYTVDAPIGGGPSRRSCAPWCSVARGQHLPRRLAALAVPDRLVGGGSGDRRRRGPTRPSSASPGPGDPDALAMALKQPGPAARPGRPGPGEQVALCAKALAMSGISRRPAHLLNNRGLAPSPDRGQRGATPRCRRACGSLWTRGSRSTPPPGLCEPRLARGRAAQHGVPPRS